MNNKTNKFNPSSLRDRKMIHCYQYVGRLPIKVYIYIYIIYVSVDLSRGTWHMADGKSFINQTKGGKQRKRKAAYWRAQQPKVPTQTKIHKAIKPKPIIFFPFLLYLFLYFLNESFFFFYLLTNGIYFLLSFYLFYFYHFIYLLSNFP